MVEIREVHAAVRRREPGGPQAPNRDNPVCGGNTRSSRTGGMSADGDDQAPVREDRAAMRRQVERAGFLCSMGISHIHSSTEGDGIDDT